MKVSVLVVTYNHEAFLGQALESVLAQSGGLGAEIVVGEDGSTDGTRDVLRGYASRYPSRFRLLLHERNLGPAQNFLAGLAACQGELVAYLEGDDLWPARQKLERQVALLQADPTASGCFANATVVDAQGRRVHDDFLAYMGLSVRGRVVRTEDIVPFGVSPACTLLFRRAIANPLPDWFLRHPCHSNLDLLITLRGAFLFQPETWGAYRLHGGGQWTSRTMAARLYNNILVLKGLYAAEEIRSRFGETVRTSLAGQLSAFVAQTRSVEGWPPTLRRLAAWAWAPPRRPDLVLFVVGRFVRSLLHRRLRRRSRETPAGR